MREWPPSQPSHSLLSLRHRVENDLASLPEESKLVAEQGDQNSYDPFWWACVFFQVADVVLRSLLCGQLATVPNSCPGAGMKTQRLKRRQALSLPFQGQGIQFREAHSFPVFSSTTTPTMQWSCSFSLNMECVPCWGTLLRRAFRWDVKEPYVVPGWLSITVLKGLDSFLSNSIIAVTEIISHTFIVTDLNTSTKCRYFYQVSQPFPEFRGAVSTDGFCGR